MRKMQIIGIFTFTILFFVILLLTTPIVSSYQLQWSTNVGIYSTTKSPLTYDINGDGIKEIFLTGLTDIGLGKIVCMNAINGNIIWEDEWTASYLDVQIPMSIGDLDNDGDYEIVHAKGMSTTIARNCEDGSTFWESDVDAGWHHLAIADTDKNGYPYVYVAQHTVGGTNGHIAKIKGTDGTLITSHPLNYPCYGGISIADINDDGEHEILINDHSYLWCFDENLNEIWKHTGAGESGCPNLIDVNGDGFLDVLSMYTVSATNGGLMLIDGSDGSVIHKDSNLGLPTHITMTVCDIDEDGNAEVITAYGSDGGGFHIFDLVNWQMDYEFPSDNKYIMSHPPKCANIFGDNSLEIIQNGAWAGSLYAFDGNYQEVGSIPEWGKIAVTDLDGDGFNNIIFAKCSTNTMDDEIICYTTDAISIAADTTNHYFGLRRLNAEIAYMTNQPPNIPSNPNPYDGESNVDINRQLYWSGGDLDGDSVTYDVYFGTSSNPSKVQSNQTSTSYNPGPLDSEKTYYWRIVAWDDSGLKNGGSIWDFTTEDYVNHPPNAPDNPNPSDNAHDIDVNILIYWSCSDPDDDPITYDIYFGTNTNPPIIENNHQDSFYQVGELNYSQTYYWKIISFDSNGNSNQSEIWSFSTISEPNNKPQTPSKPVGEEIISCTKSYNYTTSSIDQDNDDILYIWYWDNNTNGEIFGPYESGEPCTVSHQWENPGEYQIKVKARDIHSAESTISEPLSISCYDLPSVDCGGPYNGFVNQLIQFNGSVDDGYPPYYWEWKFNENSYSTEQNPQYSFENPGDYTVELTVIDNNGFRSSNSTICHIAKTGDLNVLINSLSSIEIRKQIQFSSIVEKGTPPYQYQWSFGDGTTSLEDEPYHAFSKKGVYQITLNVTDSQGLTGNDKVSITIFDPGNDFEAPTFNIIKPKINSLYLNDQKLLFWVGIFAIGDITFEIDGHDDCSGIDYVEFKIENELQSTDYITPYKWKWDDICFGQKKILITVYDRTGKFSEQEISIWKIF